MKSLKTIFILFLITGWLATVGAYWFFYPKVELRIIDRFIKIEVAVKDGEVACTPCVDEPIFDKCELESFAYEALEDNKDIYGSWWLRKGDVYFINDKYFGGENNFCIKDRTEGFYSGSCYEGSFILKHPELFKPLR